ncbi:MAG TPA: YbaK/EbsC family protein [Burkholderiaceae bacterium]|nr:YbaK/EbsC family protein [Burkholderiaceae bacterium]
MLLTVAHGKQISALRHFREHFEIALLVFCYGGDPMRRSLQAARSQRYLFNWQFAAARSKLYKILDCTKCVTTPALGLQTSGKETVMPIPLRLTDYLDQCGAKYEVSEHRLSRCSAETARTASVPSKQLAKSVIVEDDWGCVMAVVPADKSVMLGQLSQQLGRKNLHLSDENRISRVFTDCDRGAVPPVGMAWGVETIVDDELEACDVVYAEAGDHQHLLRMSHDQFHHLMSAASHGRFCKPKGR